MISKELLAVLCCPACRGELVHDAPANTLTCRACGRLYRMDEEIPVLVVGEDKKKS